MRRRCESSWKGAGLTRTNVAKQVWIYLSSQLISSVATVFLIPSQVIDPSPPTNDEVETELAVAKIERASGKEIAPSRASGSGPCRDVL